MIMNVRESCFSGMVFTVASAIIIFYYCATHMDIAQYALFCGVCPSVRDPSVSLTLVYCVETTELIIKQLALDCSLGTLLTSNTEHIFWESPHRTLNRRRVSKSCDVTQICGYIS